MHRATVNKPESSEMVLVPREPTEAMLAAADKLIDCDPQWVAKAYRAMVRVAQAVPSEQPIAEQPKSDKANLMVAVGSDLPPAPAKTGCPHYNLPRVDGAGCPDCNFEEDVEAVIACLGDDAATLREKNDECEIAENMDKAATKLQYFLDCHRMSSPGADYV